jgi:sensor c-di-GMP phosphodiesterase-like protein
MPDINPNLITSITNTTYGNVRIDFAVAPYQSDWIIVEPDAFISWFNTNYDKIPSDKLQVFASAEKFIEDNLKNYGAYLNQLGAFYVDYYMATKYNYTIKAQLSNYMKNHPDNLYALVVDETKISTSTQQIVNDSTKVNNFMNIQAQIYSQKQVEQASSTIGEEYISKPISNIIKGTEETLQPIVKGTEETLTWVIPVVIVGFLGMGYLYVYLRGRYG